MPDTTPTTTPPAAALRNDECGHQHASGRICRLILAHAGDHTDVEGVHWAREPIVPAAAGAEPKKRIVTLTDRQPVEIIERDWPIMAQANDWQGEHEHQSPRTWKLVVRQHDDGRTLVYGRYETSYQGEHGKRAGELIAPPAGALPGPEAFHVWPEIVAAIKRVGERIGASEGCIAWCIEDLPVEELR